jgi:3-isopropylmalate dehydratase small subunit
MKKFALETLIDDFAERVVKNNIIIAGENFGCGSSREQAPRVLKESGVQVIIAKSFARIFFRNAVNIGLPVVICEGLNDDIRDNDFIEVDLENGLIKCENTIEVYTCTKLPEKMTKILNSGGLINYLNAEDGVNNNGNDNM